MPGLTVVADPDRRLDRDLQVARALDGVRHFPDYVTETVFRAPALLVAATRYPDYPLAVATHGRFVVVLEGAVYDAGRDIAAELAARAAELTDERPDTAGTARWLERVDGDFVAVLIDTQTERAAILNDRYGRLPLYRATRGRATVVSRELGCATALAPARCRRLGIAEFLLFGYPLGDGTLFEDVTRLPPASLIVLPGREVHTLCTHDFDRRCDWRADDARLPAALAESLVTACRARTRPGHANVVALSGGIDSRMVAGALRTAGIPASAVTHGPMPGVAPPEVDIAERVARGLGLEWHLYPLAPPTGTEVQRLLALKGGANYLGMSHVVPYLAEIRSRYGAAITYFTGDQGDRILGDVTPVAPVATERALAEYILRKESILPPARVAAMTGIPEETLLDAVRARVAGYPERSLAQRYVHFLFYERAVRWLFEGEDRNRCHFWHVTPFYAPGVFEVAMRVPDALKRGHRLRARVLRLLAPDVADVTNAGTGGVLGSPAFAWRQRMDHVAKALLLRVLGPDGERRLKRWVQRPNGHASDSPVVRCVRSQLRASPAVREYLDPDAVEAVLHDAGRYRREQFSVVLTVTSVIDAISEHPVLDEFRHTVLA